MSIVFFILYVRAASPSAHIQQSERCPPVTHTRGLLCSVPTIRQCSHLLLSLRPRCWNLLCAHRTLSRCHKACVFSLFVHSLVTFLHNYLCADSNHIFLRVHRSSHRFSFDKLSSTTFPSPACHLSADAVARLRLHGAEHIDDHDGLEPLNGNIITVLPL